MEQQMIDFFHWPTALMCLGLWLLLAAVSLAGWRAYLY
jgi:hypothetical protein